MPTKISQGPWTRIRPLQRDELDPYTHAGMAKAELTWGIKNNLGKVMAHCPGLAQTGVEFCNKFIFDPETFRGDVQEAGFNDRFLKELVISRTSLLNRARYSITHHSFIGTLLYETAGRGDEGHRKLLHLHEYEQHPDVYTEREKVVLEYTSNVVKDAHLVTDLQFEELRRVLRQHNDQDPDLAGRDEEAKKRHVEAQIVELTWLIGHFCLLNKWFTALQVPDETESDEDDFGAAYRDTVPQDIRDRNDKVLGNDF